MKVKITWFNPLLYMTIVAIYLECVISLISGDVIIMILFTSNGLCTCMDIISLLLTWKLYNWSKYPVTHDSLIDSSGFYTHAHVHVHVSLFHVHVLFFITHTLYTHVHVERSSVYIEWIQESLSWGLEK